MAKTFGIAIILAVPLFLCSCALSKAIYLGPNDYSPRTASPFPGINSAEDINGNFPEAVYIKTKTQSFNQYHYYILDEGKIWYKSIDPEKEPQNWALFTKTGLPGKKTTNAIAEISADADELVALSAEGNFYRYCFDLTLSRRKSKWKDRQGWPVEDQLYFDSRTAANRSWALGKRNSHVLYYEDIFGNQHHNGTMEIATTYVLLEDGQEICYGDTGLPADFSRNFIGPERGTFIAASLSASASTMFVINEAGEMYTRLADFDTAGCDPMWFKYTYIPYASDLPGTDFFSNFNEWALPSEGWRPQQPIPLAGKAAITRHITILQNGRGNGARELRVAGMDQDGTNGYWSKPIFSDTWEFKAAPLSFAEDAILVTASAGSENERGRRGQPLDKDYAGSRWSGSNQEDGWEYRIPNFNILEGECDFHITWQGETCTFKLHPVEMWAYLKRDYLPGRNGSPKIFLVTLEVPENAFETLSDEFVQHLSERYGQYDRKLFHYTIAASNSFIIMRETTDAGPLLFLTDGTISGRYSELHIGRYIENYGEVQRYYSPELTIGDPAALTRDQLAEKISLNRHFIEELKYQIRVLKWSQLTAFKFNAGYLPAHYIAKITPLRFVDVPKIRTVTSYGDTMVKANSAYVFTTTTARIRLLEKIIEMLEARILCYGDMEKNFTAGMALPPWFSDNFSDYWDIAGLPRTIQGTFFAPGMALDYVPIPAQVSFVPSMPKQNISGWFLAIADSSDFSVFIESDNTAAAIYSRKGKTPQEQKLRIGGTLHINGSADAPAERDIIRRCLEPYFIANDESINVRITFDGNVFEIREHPARRGRSPIFRGTL
ncbi:MAG: hypothetical protein FWG46_06760 [Treponema sp.]|nr:hypothetical protein [Treponema sp.]